MKVFVTGASGSVGAAVVKQLLAEGHQVAALARQGMPARLAAQEVTVVGGDLENAPALLPALEKFGPDAIVHSAWLGVQAGSRNDPSQEKNVVFAGSLMALCSALSVKHLVAFGSQAEYGPQSGAIDENTITQPNTTYGEAKLESYHLMSRFAEDHGMAFTWLRLFSAYGPGDDPRWMIQSVIRQLLAKELPAMTACEQVWDYLYLDDVGAAVAAVLKSRAAGTFNLGSGQAVKLRRIVEQLRDLIDPGLPIDFGRIPMGEGQVMHLEANIGKLKAATGWSPKVGLDEGLKNCVAALKKP